MAKGTITKECLATLTKTIREQFRTELDAMKKTATHPMGLSKKSIDDIAAGHDDGMRNMITALRAKGILVVED